MAPFVHHNEEGRDDMQQSGAASPQADRVLEVPVYSRRTIALTLLGTMLVTFIATLDQTVVGTALPHIGAELQGFDQIAWVTAIYLLTMTVTIPIYGKLSDLVGRKLILLSCLIAFLIGSGLSGVAQTMPQLIVFRAFQGIGAGGLESTTLAVVGDLFPPRERGKWIGITSSSYALASIVGPLLGGLLTDHVSWRWVFFLNLPIGLIALGVLAFIMPTLRTPKDRIFVDAMGAVLVVLAILPLLLAFAWAGAAFAWRSWQSLSLFGSSLLLIILLVLYSARQERLGRDPIVEPSMFRNVRVTDVSLLASMLISIVLLGSVYFLPVFLQSVTGVSATTSGLVLIPLALASIAGAVISGQLISATGRYKGIALASAALIIAGLLLLLRLDTHSTAWDIVAALVVLGPGVGSGLSLYTITVQNAMPEKIGQASSTVIFFRQLGQSIGLVAIGAVVTSSYVPAFSEALPASLRQALPPHLITVFENPLILTSPQLMAPIHAGFASYGSQGTAAFTVVQRAVKLALAESIHAAILLSLVLMLITFVVVCFLKEVPLRKRAEP
jgi:EmrB/QacA subfamily drug resistance transporter